MYRCHRPVVRSNVMVRVHRRLTAGVYAADVETWMNSMVPLAGKLAFVGLIQSAQAEARRRLTAALLVLRGNAGKDEVTDAADWYVLTRLL